MLWIKLIVMALLIIGSIFGTPPEVLAFRPFADHIGPLTRLEKGKTFYQQVTSESEQTMKIMGSEIVQKQKQTFIYSCTPLSMDRAKNWTIRQRIEAVKVENDGKIVFDSRAKAAAANPATELYRALVDLELTLMLDPDAKLTKVEGRDEVLKRLEKANRPTKHLYDQMINDGSLTQMAEPAFALLAKRTLEKGDSWASESTLNMGLVGSYKSNYYYTHEGMQGSLERIRVDTTMKYFSLPPTDPNLPFQIIKADFKTSDAGGVILFNRERGRVEKSESTVKLHGKITIQVGDQDTEIELSQTQKTSYKATDTNPAKK